jgi:hypothetical protein
VIWDQKLSSLQTKEGCFVTGEKLSAAAFGAGQTDRRWFLS